MKILTHIIVLVIHISSLNAQITTLAWSNSLGGSQNEKPGSVIKDKFSSGFYVIGEEDSPDGDVSSHIGISGTGNMWLVKTDSIGNKIWDKSFGGSYGESGLKIFQTFDDGFVLTGTTYSVDGDVVGDHPSPGNPFSGTYDYWIFKVDSSLNIVWQRCLGGSDDDFLNDVIITKDGGYLLLGEVFSNDGDVTGFHGGTDYWAVKLDSIGNLIWQKCIGTGDYDGGISCIELSDSSYILAGLTQSNFPGYQGGTDIGIIKLSKTGLVLSQRCYGGSNIDQPCKIISTQDGGFYVVGTTNSNDGDITNFNAYFDIWIFKADSNGNIIWQNCYGGGGIDFSFDAILTDHMGLVFTGHSDSNDSLYVIGTHGGYDAWVAKIDSLGILQWGRSLGGSADDIGVSVLQIDQNKYLLAAQTESDNGDILFNHGGKDIWLSQLANNVTSVNEDETSNNYFNANLNEGILTLSFFSTKREVVNLVVFNMLGNEKFRKELNTEIGLNQFAYPIENWNGLKVISLGHHNKVIL